MSMDVTIEYGALTLSVTTFSIMTLTIKGINLSINNTEQVTEANAMCILLLYLTSQGPHLSS